MVFFLLFSIFSLLLFWALFFLPFKKTFLLWLSLSPPLFVGALFKVHFSYQDVPYGKRSQKHALFLSLKEKERDLISYLRNHPQDKKAWALFHKMNNTYPILINYSKISTN